MTLRELIRELLAYAGDLDEPVMVRVVTRCEENVVQDHLTKIVPVSRVGAFGMPVACIVAEANDTKTEKEFVDSFPREVG